MAGTNEIVVGIDLTRKAFIRGVQVNNANPGDGATVNVSVDDQFTLRADKVGFWAGVREGRILADARAIEALIV